MNRAAAHAGRPPVAPTRPTSRRLRFAAARLCAALFVFAGCGSPDPAIEDDLLQLRSEVDSLRDAAAGRLEADPLLEGAPADSNAVYVGLRTSMLREVLGQAAIRYLDDVRLHIRDTVVVTEEGEVRVGVGPLRVSAGRWNVTVSILRIDAKLRADSLALAFGDSSRIGITLPVHVTDGTGDAMIEFTWDAARVTSIVCSDFTVRERFSGYVEPSSQRVDGAFALETDGELIIAQPIMTNRISVSPQPTAESWVRVREILDRQNHIFNCGLALSPPRVEAMLRDLLTRGFRFRLPESILRPLPLPASIGNEVEVAGRRIRVGIRPLPPGLSEEWVWLGAIVEAAALSQEPIRVGR